MATWFPYPNETVMNFTYFLNYPNQVTNNFFGPAVLFMVWVLMFIISFGSSKDAGKSMAFSSFVTTIAAVLFAVLGLAPEFSIVIPVILLFVSVFLIKDKEGA